MFADYKSQVLNTYHKKKAANLLSTDLAFPTPARLKAECLNALNDRYTKKDENVLRSFFGPQPDLTAYAHTIKRFDTDKFRPLQGVLKGLVVETDNKNIELLAWLVDFPARPYVFGQTVLSPVIDQVNAIVTDPIEKEFPKTTETISSGPAQAIISTYPLPDLGEVKSGRNKIMLLSVVCLVCIATGYFAIDVLFGEEKCMYWAGDHYEAIFCNEKREEEPVYALDRDKILHFRQITKPDTITAKAIGRVWYFKSNDKFEYYTSPGFHPIHTQRRLKPLTDYIIEKYLTHN